MQEKEEQEIPKKDESNSFDFNTWLDTSLTESIELKITDKSKPKTVPFSVIEDVMLLNKAQKNDVVFPLTINKNGLKIPFAIEIGNIGIPKTGRVKACRYINPARKDEFNAIQSFSKKSNNEAAFDDISGEDNIIVTLEIKISDYPELIAAIEKIVSTLGEYRDILTNSFTVKGATITGFYFPMRLNPDQHYSWNAKENALVLFTYNRFGKKEEIRFNVPNIKYKEGKTSVNSTHRIDGVHPIININSVKYEEDWKTKRAGWALNSYAMKIYINE